MTAVAVAGAAADTDRLFVASLLPVGGLRPRVGGGNSPQRVVESFSQLVGHLVDGSAVVLRHRQVAGPAIVHAEHGNDVPHDELVGQSFGESVTRRVVVDRAEDVFRQRQIRIPELGDPWIVDATQDGRERRRDVGSQNRLPHDNDA